MITLEKLTKIQLLTAAAIVVLLMLTSSCAIKKEVSTHMNIDQSLKKKSSGSVIKSLQLENQKWNNRINTLIYRMQGFVMVPGVPQLHNAKMSMHIRIQKDSSIWISFRSAFMNLEALRLLFSPTRVSLFSPFEKTTRVRQLSYQELASTYDIPLSFNEVQEILLFHIPSKIEKEYSIDSIKTSSAKSVKALHLSWNSKSVSPLQKTQLSIATDSAKCMPLSYQKKYVFKDVSGRSRILKITQHITSNKEQLIAWQGNFVLSLPGREDMSLSVRSIKVKENAAISTPFPHEKIQ